MRNTPLTPYERQLQWEAGYIQGAQPRYIDLETLRTLPVAGGVAQPDGMRNDPSAAAGSLKSNRDTDSPS